MNTLLSLQFFYLNCPKIKKLFFFLKKVMYHLVNMEFTSSYLLVWWNSGVKLTMQFHIPGFCNRTKRKLKSGKK